VIKQLETIGLLDKRDANGYHKVMMDKDAFLNRVRGYQDLAERMRAVSASKNLNLSDVTISKTLITIHIFKLRLPDGQSQFVFYTVYRTYPHTRNLQKT
jgi:hypothetical protein